MTAHDRDILKRIVRRLGRGGSPGDAQSIADMAKDADERLFRAITTDPSMGDWAETWRRVWEDGKKLSRTK